MKRVLRKSTPVELIAAAYANEGERPVEGESRTAWLNARYVVSVDHKRNQYVARRR